jgi:hypothetical protein
VVAEVIPISASLSITLDAGSPGDWTQLGTNTQFQLQCPKQLITLTMSTSGYTFSSGERLRLSIGTAAGVTIYWDGASNNSRLVTPTIIMTEWSLLFLLLACLIPLVTGLMTRKRRLVVRIISVTVSMIITLTLLANQVGIVSAAPDVFYLHDDSTPTPSISHIETQSTAQTTETSYSLPSVAGGTDLLYLITVAMYRETGSSATVSSITGGGLTWTLQVAHCSARINNPHIEVWQAFGSPSSFSATVNISDAVRRTSAAISSYSGADPTTEGAAGSNTNGLNGACDGTGIDDANATLSLTSTENDSVLYVATHPRIRTITTPDPDYTQRAFVSNTSGGDGANLYIHDRTLATAGTDSADHTLSGTADWEMAGLVINPASSISPAGKYMNNTIGAGAATIVFDSTDDDSYWYTDLTYPTGDDDASIAAGDYKLNMYFDQLPQVPADWYDADWAYRKKITIDSGLVTANILNFPVLISLTSDSDLGNDAQDDGDDILFTSSNGTTKLSHEIESFNDSSGELQAWVKVNLSSITDTELYMYYGNDSVGSQEDVANVWTNGYIGVWHLDETGSPVSDSTTPSYNGTVSGASPNSSAQIDGGFDFVRSEDDQIEMFGTANILSLTDFTVEAWMITPDSSIPDDYYAVTQSLYCDNDESWALNIADDSGYEDQVRFTTVESGTQTRVFGPVITDNQWHYLAGVRTSTQLLMYVDDGAPTSVADGRPGETILSSANIAIGSAICTETEDYSGTIDEVRISDSARNEDWIDTTYNNHANQGVGVGKFIESLGGEETLPSVEITVSVHHTSADGSDPQEIITSSMVTIDHNTLDPYELSIGSGLLQTFTSSDPRRLRAYIDVTAVNGSGSFTLAYDSATNHSSLDTPSMVIPDVTLLLVAMVILIPIVMNLFMKKRRLAMRLASFAISLVAVLAILGQQVLPTSAAPDVFYLHDNDTPSGVSWYNVDWSYRKKITIYASQVSGDLDYFPVLINQSSDGELAANAQADGGDILFTSANGTSKLDHEIEKYIPGTGELVAWVEVPSLSGSSNTELYMYYGNATVADQWNITGTWNEGGNDNFEAVWHLDETSDQHNDSTSNGNHSTSVDVTTQGSATGQIDGADEFDRTQSDHIVIGGGSESLDVTDAITIEAWINEGAVSDKGRIVTKVSEIYVLRINWDDDLEGYLTINSTIRNIQVDTVDPVTGYVVLTWDGQSGDNKLRLYRNGGQIG